MTGALRRDHDHIHIFAWHDLVVMNVEAVSEGQCRTLLQIRRYRLIVDVQLLLVRQQNHRHIGILHRGRDFHHLMSGTDGLFHEAPSLLRPTVTLTPDSFRFWAWAWPCEP